MNSKLKTRLTVALPLWFAVIFPASIARATPTQDQVFQSIQNNLGPSVDGAKLLAVLAAGVGVAIVLVVFSKRERREALPRSLNHKGKLMRELVKTAGLKHSQAKALQALAHDLQASGVEVNNPITLLLCPSLTSKPPEKSDK
jgi:hypothetical protein